MANLKTRLIIRKTSHPVTITEADTEGLLERLSKRFGEEVSISISDLEGQPDPSKKSIAFTYSEQKPNSPSLATVYPLLFPLGYKVYNLDGAIAEKTGARK